MPEAVDAYIDDNNIFESREILKVLYDNYLADMELYQASQEAVLRSRTLFQNIYRELNKDVKFLFTVSPIRHLRDGAHDNQKSKATLLLAIDGIMARHEACHYFPAYEIVLDELRDYRFYADDMVHPSSKAIEYIWECFSECYFDKDVRRLNACIEEIARGMAHRPFNAASEGYRAFAGTLLQKMEKLEKEHPYLNFEKEKRQCNILLER